MVYFTKSKMITDQNMSSFSLRLVQSETGWGWGIWGFITGVGLPQIYNLREKGLWRKDAEIKNLE